VSEENAQGAQQQAEVVVSQATGHDDSEVGRLKAEAAQRRIENRELREKLQSIENQQREAQETAAKEQGKYKELYESEAQKAKKAEELQEQLNKYRARDEKELTSLIDKVPENLRETINDAEIPLAKRLELARGLASARGTLPDPRLPGDSGGVNQITRKQFDALSPVKKSSFVLNGGRVTD